MVGIVHASAIALLTCWWLGCAPPAPNTRPAVPTAELPAVSAAPDETVPDEPPATTPTDPWQVKGLPPPLAPSGPVVCRFPAATPTDEVVGRLRAGGETAFTASGLEISLSLVKGAGLGSAFFQGSRDGLHMRGVMNRADVRLFVAEPLVMDGWLVPRHNAPLTVRRIDSERIDVGVDPKRLADVGMQKAPRESLSCKQLRADEAELFDPWAGLPAKLPARSGWGTLVGQDPVPLSRQPGKEAVALLPATGDVGVAVFDSRRAWTRVAVPRQMVVVFGWVPSSRVQARSEAVVDLGGVYGFGTGGGGSTMRPLTCPQPLSIALALEGERALALRADPGVELLLNGNATNGLVPISFYRRYWFDLAEGASMWVRESDLGNCTRDER